MANDSDILIGLQLDLDDLKRDMARAEKSSRDNAQKISDSYTNSFKSIGSSFNLLVGGVIAGIGIGALAGTVRESIELASQQEDAVNKLNQALKSSGSFSEAASSDLQKYASQLQSMSTIGDEVILDQIAFAKSLGATNEQAKEIVKAGADMSQALGVDFNSAVRNVSKTLGGYAGELGEVLPELKNLTQEQLRAGEGIALLSSKYDGFAQSATKTFGGARLQLSNVFGDFLEEIGFVITKSPAVISLVNAISKTVETLTLQIKGTNFNETFDSAIRSTLNFAASIEGPLKNAFKGIYLAFTVVKEGIVSGFATIGATVSKSVSLVSGVYSKIAGFFGADELSSNIQAFSETTGELSESLVDRVGEAGRNISQAWNDAVKNEDGVGIFQELKNSYNEAADSIINRESGGEGIAGALSTGISAAAETVKLNTDEMINKLKSLGYEVKKTGKDITDTAKKAGFDFNSRLTNAIVGGTQVIASTLINGGNFFKAFGTFLLNTAADMATQLGAFFIATGLGIESLKNVATAGAATVAQGIALVALGSLLKSLTGGGGKSGAPTVAQPSDRFAPSPTGGGVVSSPQDASQSNQVLEDEEELRNIGTSVNVSVEGNIFDLEQTGLSIVESVNRAFESTGVQINGGAIA